MNKTIISSLLLLFTYYFGLSQSEELIKQDGHAQWKTFSQDLISIEYPEDWEIQSPGQMGTKFILFSPIRNQEDQFRENINLIIQDLSGHHMSMDQYVEASQQQIKNLITDGKLMESERIEKGGEQIHKIIFIGKQGMFELKFEQHYRIENDQAYVLTLTCIATEFDDYRERGEQIMDSFKILSASKK